MPLLPNSSLYFLVLLTFEVGLSVPQPDFCHRCHFMARGASTPNTKEKSRSWQSSNLEIDNYEDVIPGLSNDICVRQAMSHLELQQTRKIQMKLALPTLAAVAAIFCAASALMPATAHADPYRYCADYMGGRLGGSSNCYFMTFAQCQASVSGVGGFCRINGFYDGKPVRTPEDGYAYQPRQKKHRARRSG